MIDYQAVDTSKATGVEPAVTLHDDRLRTFETKKTPSLSYSDSFEPDLDAGIVSKKSISDSKQKALAAAAAAEKSPQKPAIVFRKRKINPNNQRRKGGNDD